jgi:hypothetical protein
MPALYACAETINRELNASYPPKIHDAVAARATDRGDVPAHLRRDEGKPANPKVADFGLRDLRAKGATEMYRT